MKTGEKILVLQEETLQKFGEIAIEMGFLTEKQVDELLKKQSDDYILFGEALVKIGALSEEELVANLKEFNLKKLSKE
ncbi:MAG: hypothetical protein AB1632_08755 [Nitrospirota bacterium]